MTPLPLRAIASRGGDEENVLATKDDKRLPKWFPNPKILKKLALFPLTIYIIIPLAMALFTFLIFSVTVFLDFRAHAAVTSAHAETVQFATSAPSVAGQGATTASATASAVLPQILGAKNLLLSSALLVSFGVLPLARSGMTSLAKSLLISASRCALQVSLLGSLVLQKLLGVTNPGIVGAWIFGVGLVAGREAISRIQYTYPSRDRNLYGSTLASGLTILGLARFLDLFGKVTPWFDPKTWIPIAGMLFGNTLNASALSASAITKQFASSSVNVELRWAMGATTAEAVGPLLEESYKVSLMPTINGLAATGIIHIPGMMSGQILAGRPPQQAAMYQIVVMFLISSTALLSVQMIIQSSVRSIVNTQQSRLRCGVLELSKLKTEEESPALAASKTLPTKELPPLSSQDASAPILEVRNLTVPRANARIEYLALRKGDRVAISGKSGSGKTQILRSIVGLEEQLEGGVTLLGKSVDPSTDLPAFRSRVCLVPTQKPTLEGTPNQFYEKILRYQSQQQKAKTSSVTPTEIAQRWDLPAGILDRDWTTLSGGESQRVVLAIVLALQPEVLLLDESMSLMDEATSMLVEETLKESQIPILVVTHSENQLLRFCTDKLVL